jgi:hypothetical protein
VYISPKTAGVHVSNISRKLGVSGRVQAAPLAERADPLRSRRPKHRPRKPKDPRTRILGVSPIRAARS